MAEGATERGKFAYIPSGNTKTDIFQDRGAIIIIIIIIIIIQFFIYLRADSIIIIIIIQRGWM
jgi:hypothetical protein